jgi:hypothetical protein
VHQQSLTFGASNVTRAVRLARTIVRERVLSREQLAVELAVSPVTLDMYLAGKRLMPIERQLCLAGVVISTVPRFKLEAYRLRDEVVAMMGRNVARS